MDSKHTGRTGIPRFGDQVASVSRLSVPRQRPHSMAAASTSQSSARSRPQSHRKGKEQPGTSKGGPKRSFIPKVGPPSTATKKFTARRSKSCETLQGKMSRMSNFLDDMRTPQLMQSSARRMTLGATSPRTPGRTLMLGGQGPVKDKRPLHDKAYQSECVKQFMEFLGYVQLKSNYTARSIPNISAKDFKLLIQQLLSMNDFDFEVGPKFAEDLLAVLKLLKYPGSLSKSYINDVGTQHAWPHILGLLTWLQHITELSLGVHVEDDSMFLRTEESNAYIDEHLLQEYILKSYLMWMNSEDTKALDAEFESAAAKRYGIDKEMLEQNLKEIEVLKAQVEDMESTDTVKKLKERVTALQNDRDALRRHIHKKREYKATLAHDIERTREQCKVIEQKVSEVEEQKASLKEDLSNQQYSRKELVDMRKSLELDKARVFEELNEVEKLIWPMDQQVDRLTKQVEDKLTQAHLSRLKIMAEIGGGADGDNNLTLDEMEMASVKLPVEKRMAMMCHDIKETCKAFEEKLEKLKTEVALIQVDARSKGTSQLHEKIKAAENEAKAAKEELQADYTKYMEEEAERKARIAQLDTELETHRNETRTLKDLSNQKEKKTKQLEELEEKLDLEELEAMQELQDVLEIKAKKEAESMALMAQKCQEFKEKDRQIKKLMKEFKREIAKLKKAQGIQPLK